VQTHLLVAFGDQIIKKLIAVVLHDAARYYELASVEVSYHVVGRVAVRRRQLVRDMTPGCSVRQAVRVIRMRRMWPPLMSRRMCELLLRRRALVERAVGYAGGRYSSYRSASR